jgi:hypothetical protein
VREISPLTSIMAKRIFLVGTGPSLNVTPLGLLVKEDSFSLNRIHLIYPRTDWRPTYLYYVDHPVEDFGWRLPIDLNKNICKHMWLLDEYRTGVPDAAHIHDENPTLRHYDDELDLKKVTWVKRCAKHAWYSGGNPRGMQKWHFPDICSAYNGMSAMIQIAVQMGYEEIYLTGCDLNYVVDYRANHFDPTYNDGHKPPSIAIAGYWAQSDEFNATCAHKIAKRECDERGVKIYNATVGGSLEVYPRVNLEDIVDG